MLKFLRMIILSGLNEKKKLFLSLHICLQSQEEVCDLLHAAPFQNILPRVYIKGKKPETAAR